MIKITYSGKVPSGYVDSGIDSSTILVDESKFDKLPDLTELAKHDARQCNDVTFLKILSVEHDYNGPIYWHDTVYCGIKRYYDNYFKKWFEDYKTE